MLARRIARPLLASAYVTGGIDAVMHPDAKSAAAEPVIAFVKANTTLAIPEDTSAVVRLDGVVKVVAGIALAMGRAPRISAVTLAASLVPTTIAGHPFWKYTGEQRTQQRTQFIKNASMLGGLLLAAVDTEGRPSLAWHTRRATSDLRRDVSRAAGRASRRLDETLDHAVNLVPAVHG